MVEYLTKEDFNIRASLGFVKDYYKENAEDIVEPQSNYDLLLEMFENDPVLTTAIDTTVDVGTSNGYQFLGKNKDNIKTLTEMFNHDFDFDMVVGNIMYSMMIYGDAFLEIRYKSGKPSELHALETTEMKIRYDKHGDILGYVQEPKGYTKKVFFKKNEVIHFKLKDIGSRVYSYTPFKSIMRDYSTNKYANNYLASIFKNFPPRLLYVLKTANKEQTKAFIQNLKLAKNQPNKDLVGWGEIETKETGVFDFSKGMTDILNHLRTNILMITKVPPIWVGIPDNSNRSNSEAQIRSFETRIKAIQNKIASSVNKQLLESLGFSRKSVQFKFNAFSLMEEKTVIDNVKILKEVGLDDESLLAYIKDHGVKLRPDAKIEKEEPPMMGMGMPGKPTSGNRGADSNGVGRKTNLDANGVSAEGKKKTEKKDLGVRSSWSYEAIQDE